LTFSAVTISTPFKSCVKIIHGVCIGTTVLAGALLKGTAALLPVFVTCPLDAFVFGFELAWPLGVFV
jgi:hypothetical protein